MQQASSTQIFDLTKTDADSSLEEPFHDSFTDHDTMFDNLNTFKAQTPISNDFDDLEKSVTLFAPLTYTTGQKQTSWALDGLATPFKGRHVPGPPPLEAPDDSTFVTAKKTSFDRTLSLFGKPPDVTASHAPFHEIYSRAAPKARPSIAFKPRPPADTNRTKTMSMSALSDKWGILFRSFIDGSHETLERSRGSSSDHHVNMSNRLDPSDDISSLNAKSQIEDAVANENPLEVEHEKPSEEIVNNESSKGSFPNMTHHFPNGTDDPSITSHSIRGK